MKIVICNSVKFWKEAKSAKAELERLGHFAVTHPMEIEFNGKRMLSIEYYKIRKSNWNNDIEKAKEGFMRDHFDKIMNNEAVLILNVDKDEKKNYIGGNTFLEMGLAFALNKKIFLLNPIPEDVSYSEEIKGMKPVVLNGDLGGIK